MARRIKAPFILRYSRTPTEPKKNHHFIESQELFETGATSHSTAAVRAIAGIALGRLAGD